MKKIFALTLFAIFALPAYAAVNVNTASVDEVANALHGIGHKKAQAIVEYCQKHACHQPEDLLNVKGVGAKTLEKIKSDLVFEAKHGGHDHDMHEGHKH